MSIMRRAAYAAGMMIRETGQALDRAGSRLQGRYAFTEQLSRHRQIMNLRNEKPIISSDVFLAPSATLIGNVEVGASASVWYGAVVRADEGPVSIGSRAAIGDRAVVTGASAVGDGAIISCGAVVEGAAIGEHALLGAGAVVMRGATVGAGAFVQPGAVVGERVSVGERQVWAGAPARMVRSLEESETSDMAAAVDDTVALAGAHAGECGKTHQQIEAEKLRQKLLDERSDDYNSHLGLLGREKEIVEVQARFIEADRDEQRKVGAV